MSKGQRWTADDIPDQRGRVAIVTGANTGIGFETARALAERGAAVVLACRDEGRARRAADRLGRADVVRCDLASLASVRDAAKAIRDVYPRIDLLVNNAGVMMTPYTTTQDGFELQLGVNHFGHFALTGLLLDHMLEVPGSRVVTISSLAHKPGRIDFDDLDSTRRYSRMGSYYQSKLANLLFAYELRRRLTSAGASTVSVAAHPGKSRTELVRYLPRTLWLVDLLLEQPFGQSAAMGALPALRAATDPDARGGDYYGPGGRRELRGYPRRVESSERARDVAAGQRLWAESERRTGVSYPV